MDSDIKKLIDYFIDIAGIHDYQFREVCGFTFVFKRDFLFINNQLSSGEIRPVGIIYEENDEYYLAPLDKIDEIDEVIHQFVRNKQP